MPGMEPESAFFSNQTKFPGVGDRVINQAQNILSQIFLSAGCALEIVKQNFWELPNNV